MAARFTQLNGTVYHDSFTRRGWMMQVSSPACYSWNALYEVRPLFLIEKNSSSMGLSSLTEYQVRCDSQ